MSASHTTDDILEHGSRPTARRPEPPPPAVQAAPPAPAWARPALAALLLATAALYTWTLSESGYANSFYSAAAQAGSQSWKAMFFGSLDAANAITVDKPPASLWAMALSVRLLGLSSWSILLPQALMGVATVGVLYAAVRRRFSVHAALLAGAALALTPVATLMFRFDNPDALLVLVLTAAAYATLRALEHGRTRWLLFAGALVGLGFLTKQLQAFLVLPAFGLTYLVAAPKGLGRRVVDLLLAFATMVVAAGWWVLVVSLWPADSRPYIGGSQNNSILELTLGYNGLGRLTGNQVGSVGGGGNGGNGGMWGETGIGRMFTAETGGQIAWLLPAALLLLATGLWFTRRAARTDLGRASLLLWGRWLLVTGLIFSFMQGIFHAYYTVALAPAAAALVGIGAALAWQHRRSGGVVVLGLASALSSVWAFALLGRSADFMPWLRWAVLVVGLVAALGLVAGALLGRRTLAVAAAAAVIAGLAGPAAYSAQTAVTAHTGSIVTAGPATAGGSGPGGMPGGMRAGGRAGMPNGMPPNGMPNGMPPGGFGGPAPTGTDGPRTNTTAGGGTGRTGGGMGGLLDGAAVGDELAAALSADAGSYTWVAAAVGAQNAASYQLATELPVMAIGGFNGSDPSPTLAQFKDYVAQGRIHYFIGGGGFGPSMGGSSSSSEISSWVQETFTATTVSGTTVYDLTSEAS